jgi:fatty acid desaturase
MRPVNDQRSRTEAKPPHNPQPLEDLRTLGQLFADLSREITTLLRQEVQLARAEVTSKIPRLGKDVAFVVAGGAVAYAGLLALVATAIIALAYALPWWLAALIVGVLVTAGGALLAWTGLTAIKKDNPAPRQTLASIKEDVEFVKEQVT